MSGELDALIDELDEEQKENLLNDSGSSFSVSDVNKALNTAYADIETPEIMALNDYLDFLETKPKKPAKLDYVANELAVNWDNIEANKGGDYGKSKVSAYIKTLQATHKFTKDSDEAELVQISDSLDEEKTLKLEIKADSDALHQKTKETIEALDDATVMQHKWIVPLDQAMMQLADDVVSELTLQTQALADKYADTYMDAQRLNSENELAGMIDQLTGDTFDMAGLQALQSIIKALNNVTYKVTIFYMRKIGKFTHVMQIWVKKKHLFMHIYIVYFYIECNMSIKQQTPKIRFIGFNEDWVEQKLSEVASYRNGKAHEKDIADRGMYIVVNSKFVSTEGKSKKFTNRLIEPLYQNEVAFVLSDVPNGRAIAKAFLVEENNRFSLNQRICCSLLLQVGNIHPYFFYIIINRHQYFKFLTMVLVRLI